MRHAAHAAVIVALLAGPCAAAPAPPPREAPDFALKALDGHNQRLSEFRGEPVVVTFWASWCGPCRETLTALDQFAMSAQLPVLGVNIEGQPERAASIADSLRLRMPTLLDARQDVARAYDISKLPLTLLIDPDGKVRATWAGSPVDVRALSRELQALRQE